MRTVVNRFNNEQQRRSRERKSCGLDVKPEVAFREGHNEKEQNMRIRKLQLALLAAGFAGIMSASAAIVANFDDLSLNQTFATGGNNITWDVMPTTYAGLTWQGTPPGGPEPAQAWEVVQMNAAFNSAYGALLAQSGNQAAYNGGSVGGPLALSVGATPFYFNGAYFASWPNSSPAGASSVTVQGLLNGVLEWSITQNINASGWTLFNGTGTTAVNELLIGAGSNNPWLMDTLSYSPVPEPTTMVAGAGALGLALLGIGRARRSSVVRIGK
jgi:hypothetical protein